MQEGAPECLFQRSFRVIFRNVNSRSCKGDTNNLIYNSAYMSAGMAYPMLSSTRAARMTPIKRPRASNNGPPELPWSTATTVFGSQDEVQYEDA
jgi:hypothetical protein